MSPQHNKILAIFLIICSGIATFILTSDKNNKSTGVSTPTIISDTKIQKPVNLQIENKHEATIQTQDQDKLTQKQDIAEGVNTLFYDKPEVQVAWMKRGKNIVINNKADADDADFRNTFFHRGVKARPVTCGEVQFKSEGEITNAYQRFIYTGVQSTYLEDDIVNFDIFWSMMCEQTLDEYFESR